MDGEEAQVPAWPSGKGALNLKGRFTRGITLTGTSKGVHKRTRS